MNEKDNSDYLKKLLCSHISENGSVGKDEHGNLAAFLQTFVVFLKAIKKTTAPSKAETSTQRKTFAMLKLERSNVWAN